MFSFHPHQLGITNYQSLNGPVAIAMVGYCTVASIFSVETFAHLLGAKTETGARSPSERKAFVAHLNREFCKASSAHLMSGE